MIRIRRTLFMFSAILSVAFMATGCTQDEGLWGQDTDKNAVTINFKTDDFSEVTTRAVSESRIHDMTILEFVDGKLYKKVVLTGNDFTQSIKVYGLAEIAADTSGETNVLYFLANIDDLGWNTDTYFKEGTTTFSQFKALTYKFTDLSALSGLHYIPMYGSINTGFSNGNDLSVTLTRAMSFVKFSVDLSSFAQNPVLEEKEGAITSSSVSNIQLHNIPLTLSMPYAYSSDATYPTYSETDFVTSTDAAELAQTNNSEATTLEFYMPANCRGTLSGTTTYAQKKNALFTKSDDYKSVSLNGAYQGVTYITFDVNYTTANKYTEKTAHYYIPLGSDNTADLNMKANTKYTVTTTVKGANDESTNIVIDEVFNITDVTLKDKANYTLLENANCYMLDATNINDNKYNGKTLILPLWQARVGWKTVQDNDDTDNDYITDFDALIQAGHYTIETLWSTVESQVVSGETASALLEKPAKGNATMKIFLPSLRLCLPHLTATAP